MNESKPSPVQEDPAKLAAFEARIAAGESIEPKDWMPERYRRQLKQSVTIASGSRAAILVAMVLPRDTEAS